MQQVSSTDNIYRKNSSAVVAGSFKRTHMLATVLARRMFVSVSNGVCDALTDFAASLPPMTKAGTPSTNIRWHNCPCLPNIVKVASWKYACAQSPSWPKASTSPCATDKQPAANRADRNNTPPLSIGKTTSRISIGSYRSVKSVPRAHITNRFS